MAKFSLTLNDQVVLSVIQLNGHASSEEVARTTGLHPMKVRRVRDSLIERGFISILPVIDVYPLGFVHHGIMFSIGATSQSARQKFLNALLRSDQIAYLAELGSAHQYYTTIVERDINSVMLFLDKMAVSFGSVIKSKAVNITVRLSEVPIKFSNEKPSTQQVLEWGVTNQKYEIEEVDHEILKSICKNPHLSQAAHSKMLNISPMTYSYRLERLRKNGVLKGFKTNLNTDKIGMMTFNLLISLKGLSKEWRSAMFKFGRNHPKITCVCENFGEWDYELYVVVEMLREVSEIMSEVEQMFPNCIAKMEAVPILNIMKVTTYPFSRWLNEV